MELMSGLEGDDQGQPRVVQVIPGATRLHARTRVGSELQSAAPHSILCIWSEDGFTTL